MENNTISSCQYNKNHKLCTKPVQLPCQILNNTTGYACLKCIKQRTAHTGLFLCPNCNSEHNFNFKLNKIDLDVEINNCTESRIDKDLANDLLNTLNKSKNTIQDKISPKNESIYSINSLFEYIEYEMEIRVESINSELNNLQTKMKRTIKDFKSKNTELINETRSELTQKTDNSNENGLLKLQALESNFIKLNKSNQETNEFIKTFEKLKTKKLPNINSTIIGYLHCSPHPISQSLLVYSKLNVEVIDMRDYLHSACGLSEVFLKNKQKYSLAITDFAENDVKLLDHYESFIIDELKVRSVKPIPDQRFRRNRITQFYAICNSSQSDLLYEEGSFYICDMELHRVLIIDLELKRLKRIVQGTGENLKLEFECPRDICYFDKHFYVLDQGALSVDRFTHDGDFCDSFYFNEPVARVENPWSVRVSENTMVLIDWQQKILVFDLNMRLKCTIEQLNVLSMCFIRDNVSGGLHLFAHSENGDLKGYKLHDNEPEVIFNRNQSKLKIRSEFMLFSSNRKFVLSCGWSKAIAIVDIIKN